MARIQRSRAALAVPRSQRARPENGAIFLPALFSPISPMFHC